jgi:hypothetical protein
VDAKQTKKGEGSMRRRQTASPSNGIENLYDPFHQDEGDQSPAQQGKIPPQRIKSDFPDQEDQQADSQKDAADMEFLH